MTMVVSTNEASIKNSPPIQPQSNNDRATTSAQGDEIGGDEKVDLGANNEGKICFSEVEGDESEKGGPAVVTKTKAKPTVQKKKKKPKDMPHRPLTGYNIFFKEERARMLTESSGRRGPGETEGEGEPKDSNELPPAKGVKIGFVLMAKTVGKRWKGLPEEELARYKAMAKLDMERYRREMDGYHVDLAKRSRLECEEMSRAQQAAACPTVQVAAQRHPGMRNPQPQAEQEATTEKPAESSKRKRDDQVEDKKKKMNFSITSSANDFVQWDALADTKWGRNPLTKYVSVPELDDLVGWATHVQGPAPAVNVNPLLGLPSAPLQPSLLMYLESTVSEIFSAQKRSDQWESFDQSALIAIGVALEEMITTNLLPLAQLHVNRCRQLEVIPGNEEKLFSEWTLPPEEAVEKLVEKAKSQQEPEVCLATAYPSTRSMIPHAPGTSLLNQPSAERRNTDARLVWCRALGLKSAFVKSNMETLRIFLPK